MPFDLQPTLQGQVVRLEPLKPTDFEALYAVASDPLIWEQHPNSDRHKEDVFREFFREALESGGAFLIYDAATGQLIGSSRYHGYNEEKREIEIGWTFLARSHWGGTYNRELKALMLQHAFQYVESVLFVVGPQNFRSQQALRKIGAIPIGSRLKPNGREDLVFQITAASFGSGPLSPALKL